MGFDLKVQEEDFTGNEDRRWLGVRLGMCEARSITLDVSTFTVDHLTKGNAIPSGALLAKITATGKYGPYAANAEEVQRITVDATGGTFTITFDGETTAGISATAAASAVKTALEGLANINPGDVAVSGGPGNAGGSTPYLITFKGQYEGENVPAVTTAAGSLTGGAGTAAVTTTVGGGSAIVDGRQLTTDLIFLFTTTRVGPRFTTSAVDLATAADVAASGYWGPGVIKTAFLPAFASTANGLGELDLAARAAMPNIRFED